MSQNETFNIKIEWKNHPESERYFYAYVNSKLMLLRMNDFPDEPLFTLIDGLQIIDFDDAPDTWIIPSSND